MKRAQLLEMSNQQNSINAQLSQVKMEQDQYRAQLSVFQSNTAAAEQNAQNQLVRLRVRQDKK